MSILEADVKGTCQEGDADLAGSRPGGPSWDPEGPCACASQQCTTALQGQGWCGPAAASSRPSLPAHTACSKQAHIPPLLQHMLQDSSASKAAVSSRYTDGHCSSWTLTVRCRSYYLFLFDDHIHLPYDLHDNMPSLKHSQEATWQGCRGKTGAGQPNQAVTVS